MKDLKKFILQKEYFLFDMDGTMFDLEKLNFNSAEATLEKIFQIDVTFDEYKEYIAGARIREAIKRILKHEGIEKYNEDELIKKFREYKKSNLQNNLKNVIEVKDGLIDFLNYLKRQNKKLAVATSSHKSFVLKIFKKFKVLDFFDAIVTADDVINTKPDPEPFLKALKSINGKKQDAVIFEDSKTGLTAAKASGIFTIAIYTPGLNDEFIKMANIHIKSYKELIF